VEAYRPPADIVPGTGTGQEEGMAQPPVDCRDSLAEDTGCEAYKDSPAEAYAARPGIVGVNYPGVPSAVK